MWSSSCQSQLPQAHYLHVRLRQQQFKMGRSSLRRLGGGAARGISSEWQHWQWRGWLGYKDVIAWGKLANSLRTVAPFCLCQPQSLSTYVAVA